MSRHPHHYTELLCRSKAHILTDYLFIFICTFIIFKYTIQHTHQYTEMCSFWPTKFLLVYFSFTFHFSSDRTFFKTVVWLWSVKLHMSSSFYCSRLQYILRHAVFPVGPIGLVTLLVAKAMGASQVIISGEFQIKSLLFLHSG